MDSLDVDDLAELLKILGFSQLSANQAETISTIVSIKCNVSGKEIILAGREGFCQCETKKEKNEEEKSCQFSYTKNGVTVTQDIELFDEKRRNKLKDLLFLGMQGLSRRSSFINERPPLISRSSIDLSTHDYDSDGEPRMKKRKSMESVCSKDLSLPKSIFVSPASKSEGVSKLIRQDTFTTSPVHDATTSHIISQSFSEDISKKLIEAESLSAKLNKLLSETRGSITSLDFAKSRVISPSASILNVSAISKSGKELKRRSGSLISCTSSPRARIIKSRTGLNSTSGVDKPTISRNIPRRIPSLNLPSFALKKQILAVNVNNGPGTYKSLQDHSTPFNIAKSSKDLTKKKATSLYGHIKPTIARYSSLKK